MPLSRICRIDMDSYALKMERATHLLVAIRRLEARYLATHPAELVPEYDLANYSINLRFVVNLPAPEMLGPLVGDFLFNLRSCLDHVIYQMTFKHAGHPLPKTAFPIFENPEYFHARKRDGAPAPKGGLYMIRGIPDAAQEIVEEAQPYHNEQGFRRDPLWLINELNNIDKHRTVHIATTYPREANTSFNLPVHQESLPGGPFDAGSVIAVYSVEERYRLTDVVPTSRVDCQVLIKEGEPPIERPLGEACEVLLRAVSVDYLPHFAPFL